MALRIEPLTGAALEAALDDVAALRIEVFRAWPYLYDGDLAYERDYMQSYRGSPRAVVVGAFDGSRLVGAATGTPLADHADDFAAAFAGTGIDLSTVFYCAESVLLPEYRGQGAGHGFFDAREAHARTHGFSKAAFCGVMRPADHPLRPADYAPLDPFWRKRGYAPLPDVVAEFSWRDVDQPGETRKPLQFWIRDL
ncbi:GNAT family N-acetyltransferase [Phaeobacter sp. QD34_3]|uniref:GNAT family N-acetyltransferase n=1 Tax=unclassified Phaeobacter TaxID=2621772 RepID=UPI00237F5C52|nr:MULTISPECIES: GNAT family N-acetyltransferase [unclassified Phaeobacter]MDE4134222.1 GNAT family N-acetyltransferase [Phaeobacter sp. QD34_3]MDE4137964.1 GNAT family N-acetyltransferase [Phaeobacter sp. QD34_24]MDE4174853.1 GNAT family N-acetyltransferase [Phaeobacter sp. PT47_59]